MFFGYHEIYILFNGNFETSKGIGYISWKPLIKIQFSRCIQAIPKSCNQKRQKMVIFTFFSKHLIVLDVGKVRPFKSKSYLSKGNCTSKSFDLN